VKSEAGNRVLLCLEPVFVTCQFVNKYIRIWYLLYLVTSCPAGYRMPLRMHTSDDMTTAVSTQDCMN